MFAHVESGVNSNESNILSKRASEDDDCPAFPETGQRPSHREFKRYWIVGGHMVLILI